jgi:hypothetical protein
MDIKLTEGSTNSLFVTLTDNPALSNVDDAWENIGHRWNRFLSAVKHRWGKIDFTRAWEATVAGRPHIHALIVFHASTFQTFIDSNGLIRIVDKREFESYWDSFIDIQAPWSVSTAFAYIAKEVLKHTVDFTRGSTTLALLWLHRKRGFSLSRGFQSAIKRLDKARRNSKSVERALDLLGIPIDDLADAKWVVVGVYSWSSILERRLQGQKEGLWSYELSGPPHNSSSALERGGISEMGPAATYAQPHQETLT